LPSVLDFTLFEVRYGGLFLFIVEGRHFDCRPFRTLDDVAMDASVTLAFQCPKIDTVRRPIQARALLRQRGRERLVSVLD